MFPKPVAHLETNTYAYESSQMVNRVGDIV
jgi:hypothetical protein